MHSCIWGWFQVGDQGFAHIVLGRDKLHFFKNMNLPQTENILNFFDKVFSMGS